MLETCSSPTFLDQYDNGSGPRLFVSCFDDGEIYVFDPNGAAARDGRSCRPGPGRAGFRRSNADRRLFVGFGDNDISVIDLMPGSRTEYHVIQRIGFPSTVPR